MPGEYSERGQIEYAAPSAISAAGSTDPTSGPAASSEIGSVEGRRPALLPDSDAFFHLPGERRRGRRIRVRAAKALCDTCPVIAQCLDHALQTREPYGIWGGRSEEERADMLGLQSLRYPARIAEPAEQVRAQS